MRLMLYLLIAGLTLSLGCTEDKPSSQKPAGEGPPIELQTITVKDLESAIAAQKGKIVVVDVWATWCPPCRKEFHNLVEIHQAKAKDGVVCMAVAISNPGISATDASNREKAIAFLAERKASFANYVLNKEESEKLGNSWHYEVIPAVFVYDREGKQIPFIFDDSKGKSFTYNDVKKKVNELLAKK